MWWCAVVSDMGSSGILLVDPCSCILQLSQHSCSEEKLGAPDLVLLWLHTKFVEELLACLQHRLAPACKSIHSLQCRASKACSIHGNSVFPVLSATMEEEHT